jgi:hypothetical protein
MFIVYTQQDAILKNRIEKDLEGSSLNTIEVLTGLRKAIKPRILSNRFDDVKTHIRKKRTGTKSSLYI